MNESPNRPRAGLSRRDLLKAGGAALAATAAGPYVIGTRVAAAATPKPGGEFRFRGYTPPHFDPHLTASYTTMINLSFTHSRLLKHKAGPGVTPGTFPVEGDLADPAFYRLSVRDAIAAGMPFVVVFATPAFCTSRTCGPALELAKSVAPDYAGRVNFVHVEPYELESVGGHVQLRTDASGSRILVPAVEEWGIPSEPYVFVVDADGNVAAKFEGPADTTELVAALDAVLP